ncbi:hypothetical protein ASPTUDRAFT_390438 [Aspergillus tubingensis CBS 134.48]|uniref:Uncharacterized protein n=1 Tax=Aspergillus tubingensis (strain CBS 134.48) TaxID=767770 RepID=A0A1L9NHL8_ASPTC|nr:hypothetical protein ASPTUDRAFT_390438 [Aspergillus tubingensis CBS 134.48]
MSSLPDNNNITRVGLWKRGRNEGSAVRSGEGTGGKNDNNDNSYLHITIDKFRTFLIPLLLQLLQLSLPLSLIACYL